MIVFSMLLVGVGIWSLDGRFYRHHEVEISRERVVVRSDGLLGKRTRLNAAVSEVRAWCVEPLWGFGLPTLVISVGSRERFVRLHGLSATEGEQVVALIDQAGNPDRMS